MYRGNSFLVRFVLLAMFWMIGVSAVFAAATRQTQLTASDLEILQDEEQWQKLWVAVGSGADLDINSTVPLTREQQAVALSSLVTVIDANTKVSGHDDLYNEKYFVKIMHYILSEKDLYVQGYVTLAHHAMLRKPSIGASMYAMLPFDKEAWDKLPKTTIVTAFYYKQEYELCIKHAEKLKQSADATKVDKDYALSLELASRFRLEQPDACERIMKVNASEVEPENNREMVRLYQQMCRERDLKAN